MTPAELRAVLAELGLTDGQVAARLRLGGHGDRTVRRWKQEPGAKGHRPIPGPAQVALEMMLAMARATPAGER